jgi:hypothetical protein
VDLPRLLRPTAQVFKSYIDILGTPFPEDKAHEFITWLRDSLSIDLPQERIEIFMERYRTLEALLLDIENNFADLGFVIGTSSGTSGRATIMVRDKQGADKAIEAYRLSVYNLWGTKDDHKIIFIMPEQTRIVMAWLARLATEHLGMSTQATFTIPFSASPDQVRIRTGRTYKPGFRGWRERKILNPFMNWMNVNYVTKRFVKETIDLLEKYAATDHKVLLFGGWVQLHAVYLGLVERGYGVDGKVLQLNRESMIGTGGGLKELYPYSTAQIRDDLATVLQDAGGSPIPHRDVYGMAEANWAAAQCQYRNYHLPPWILSVVLDDDDEIIQSPEGEGLLAFFDPLVGESLFPNFFKTADQVQLVNGGLHYDPGKDCPCGYQTAYIRADGITRRDRLDEAGCAGQI